MLLLLAGQCSATQAETIVDSGDIAVQQRAAGAATGFPGDFSASFIQLYDKGLHDGIVDTFQKAGVTIAPEDVDVSTTVETFGTHKALKSKVQVPSRLFMYQFAGVAGSKVMVIVCTSRTGRAFETSGTECERQAAEAFGA